MGAGTQRTPLRIHPHYALLGRTLGEGLQLWRAERLSGRHYRETVSHSLGVAAIASLIGIEMGLTEAELQVLMIKAAAHDFGKWIVGNDTLGKPGKLDDFQYDNIKIHTVAGPILTDRYNIGLFRDVGATEIQESHHEKYNGSGYPWGLSGDSISRDAYIVMMADAAAVLHLGRPYQNSMSLPDVVNRLRKDRGTHFHPDVFDAFERAVTKLTGQLPSALESAEMT